ncbi:hypothetical protein AB0G73_18840 [Streptomyces sp. NPDC020719]|uniref:hypothetical protein n=1 Tax=Streptomyces sp. NPDC020719 TaxID=3154896 RepID=UPI0033FEFD12
MHARFEPLPAQHRIQEAHDAAAALRERPREWAHLDTLENLNRATNLGHRIRTGKHPAFRPAGAFEAKARSAGDGTAHVYARYVGTIGVAVLSQGEAAEQRATHPSVADAS